MELVERVKERVRVSGVESTLRYAGAVFKDEVNNFFYETFLDLKYSKRLLRGNMRTRFKQLGANDVYHTDYGVMPLIFEHVNINSEDVLVDVGCGKGRVINYWLSRGYPNKIIGLELDPTVAEQTTRQFSQRKQVNIIAGDAVSQLPVDGTVFYFYNPFSWDKVVEFEAKLATLTERRQVTVIYYNPKSLAAFPDRRWDVKVIDFEKDLGIKRWGRINKYHRLAIVQRVFERGEAVVQN